MTSGKTNKKKKILVVDDDPATVKLVAANLESNGYSIIRATNGEEALTLAAHELPSMVILDIMMPQMDGFEVCRRLWEWSRIPVIMLSARSDEQDKVKCLDLGADDYICKPFDLDEMLARIRAIFRRMEINPREPDSPPPFSSGDLSINFAERRVMVGSVEVELTQMEFALIHELAVHSPKILTYQMLLQRVWGIGYGNSEREYLHTFIYRLRKKLETDSQNPEHIQSIRGIGYRLV